MDSHAGAAPPRVGVTSSSILAELKRSLNDTVRNAESTPALIHPPWIDQARQMKHAAHDKSAVANSFALDTRELREPTSDEVANFPVKIDLTKLRLMMGQKSELAIAARKLGSAAGHGQMQVRFQADAAAAEDEVAAPPPPVATSQTHRPLKLFGSQLVRGGGSFNKKGQPGGAAAGPRPDIDITGARTVLATALEGPPSSVGPQAADALSGTLARPASAAARSGSRPATAGSTFPKLSADKTPMHARYAAEMARQLGAVKGLVAANKASLLSDMDAMLQPGWKPPLALVYGTAGAAAVGAE